MAVIGKILLAIVDDMLKVPSGKNWRAGFRFPNTSIITMIPTGKTKSIKHFPGFALIIRALQEMWRKQSAYPATMEARSRSD
jgi:hypothetical protein